MTMEHNVKWQVSLNNGETLYEGKGNFVEVEGELSAWNKMIQYITENNLEITSLSLYTNSGQRWNLPSKGGNPKFRAFDIAQKPFKLQLERVQGMDWDDQNNPDIYTTINAFYDYEGVIYKLSIWVDEKNTNNTWTLFTKQ
jgi:hypothetical protein